MSKRIATALTALLFVSGVAFTLGYVSHSSPSTSTAAVTTTTSDLAQPATAMWPFANTPLRFSDPVTAASSFAVSYLGFSSPIVSKFMQGDGRSGEVTVRSVANGPLTTILVRQLDRTDTWWVLGASTATIQITTPALLDTLSSPATLRGSSTAFEAQVNVELRADQSLTPIGMGTAMGGSMGEMGPFHSEVTFSPAPTKYGVIVMRTYSARDGQVLEAAALRIKYAN